MNVENIKLVRDHIAALPPERFDMSQPEMSVVLAGGCGCIEAHGRALLGNHGWRVTLNGLDEEARADLVMPAGWNERGHYTIPQAVAVLDHLLATGEVDWRVAERVAA